jgi:hypothetical protein
MSFITVKHTLANTAEYWIGKVYYNLEIFYGGMTGGGFVERKQVISSQVITPPRTTDFREIETFNRLVSKRVYNLIQFSQGIGIAPIQNPTTSAGYWIERKIPWQLGLSLRSRRSA